MNLRNGGMTLHRSLTSKKLYLRVKAGRQRDQYLHRLIAAAWLHRPLREEEQVHHIDGNTTDNRPQNLAIAWAGQHSDDGRESLHFIPLVSYAAE